MADFGWALQQMKAARALRRRIWNGNYVYLGADRLGDPTFYQHAPHMGDFVSEPTKADLLAEDWELYEEPKPEPKLVEKFECLFYAKAYRHSDPVPAFLTYAGAVEYGESQLRKCSWARAFTVNKYYELGEP